MIGISHWLNLEALFEAGPFLLLQMYVVITQDDYNWFTIISLVATCSSLGYAPALTNREANREANREHNLQGQFESVNAFIVLTALCAVDACLRTVSFGLLLKVVESIVLRGCIVGCCLTAYFLFGFFCKLLGGACCSGFVAMMIYPVVNCLYYELESTCRGMINVTFFFFVYTRDVITVEVLSVNVALSMLYVIVSIWRISVREDKEMVRARALYLLTCSCCMMKRVRDTTLKDDEGSDVESYNSLHAKS